MLLNERQACTDILAGINLSFARLLLSRNCNVVFADLALRTEAQKTVDENGDKAVFVETDVTKWDQLSKMFEVAEEEFGGADIVGLNSLSLQDVDGWLILLRSVPALVYTNRTGPTSGARLGQLHRRTPYTGIKAMASVTTPSSTST